MSDGLVLGAMGVTAATVFLSEGWANNYQAWVVAKTTGREYAQVSTTKSLWSWSFGLAATTVVLVAAADNDTLAPLAKAVAVVIAGASIISPKDSTFRGAVAVRNLQGLFGAGGTPSSTALENAQQIVETGAAQAQGQTAKSTGFGQ